MDVPIRISAAEPGAWPAIEKLFGERGACGGCWCMYWRLPAKDFEAGKGAGNRVALKRLVSAGGSVGLIAHRGEEPVGWCAIAPRSQYVRLGARRQVEPADGAVWSIVCLFIAKGERRKGLSVQLVKAACDHAARRGARFVDAYPVIPKNDSMPAVFAWTGLLSTYEKAGFEEISRSSAERPIMRWTSSPR